MVKSVYYIDTKNKTKQHQHHGQIVVSSESSVQLGNIEFAVTSEVSLWNRIELDGQLVCSHIPRHPSNLCLTCV